MLILKYRAVVWGVIYQVAITSHIVQMVLQGKFIVSFIFTVGKWGQRIVKQAASGPQLPRG